MGFLELVPYVIIIVILSYGDEIGVATPLEPAIEKTEAERIVHIARVAQERNATDLVIGYPYNMDGSAGFKAKKVTAKKQVPSGGWLHV